eukprot:2221165-Prymnesium_polylepis.4
MLANLGLTIALSLGAWLCFVRAWMSHSASDHGAPKSARHESAHAHGSAPRARERLRLLTHELPRPCSERARASGGSVWRAVWSAWTAIEPHMDLHPAHCPPTPPTPTRRCRTTCQHDPPQLPLPAPPPAVAFNAARTCHA